MGIPDLRFINRRIPVTDVAQALGLRVGTNGNIHCWRPDHHQNGDRTASVGIRKPNNTVKCFGCGIGPLGVADFVMSVLGMMNAAAAARWIAGRLDVPQLAPGRHLVEPERRIFRVGFEREIGLLVQSGLWVRISPTARSIVPVLLELGEPLPRTENRTIQISYRALSRFAGIVSPNATAAALRELGEIHWLHALPLAPKPGAGPIRDAVTYLVTPRSDELLDLANANFAQMRTVETEKQFRNEQRKKARTRTAY